MTNAQAATSPAAAFPADFCSLISEVLTGRPASVNDAPPTNTPAVQYTVCDEDDGYYD